MNYDALIEAFLSEWERAPVTEEAAEIPRGFGKIFCVRDILTDGQFIEYLPYLLSYKSRDRDIGTVQLGATKYLLVA